MRFNKGLYWIGGLNLTLLVQSFELPLWRSIVECELTLCKICALLPEPSSVINTQSVTNFFSKQHRRQSNADVVAIQGYGFVLGLIALWW